MQTDNSKRAVPFGLWVILVVSGICCLAGFYMSFLGFRVGDSGAYLFAGFGLLAAIFFGSALAGIKSRQKAEARLTAFVPHWFIMLAIIIFCIIVLASIIIQLFS